MGLPQGKSKTLKGKRSKTSIKLGSNLELSRYPRRRKRRSPKEDTQLASEIGQCNEIIQKKIKKTTMEGMYNNR